ncbi:MAG: 2-hydroxyacid dehydrogenase [Candidatus Levyibacteriota bacterium]
MKIVNLDINYIYPEHREKLKDLGELIIYEDIPSEEEGIRRMEDADIVISSWFPISEKILSKANKLKYLTIAATGYDWVAIKAAGERNIPVSNVPSYSIEAVAEHTISLLLSACRFDSRAERDMRNGKWDNTLYKGKELNGKILGIIGYGNIGKRVAEIAKNGFNMKILYTNTTSSKQEHERVLRSSDFISINAPLTDKTKGMIGKREFELMKDKVVIVNTGKGAVLNERELIRFLKSGKVFAAGIDVFEKEPISKENPLLTFPNVTLTPHISYNTEEAQHALSQITLDNIVSFLNGSPKNIVN